MEENRNKPDANATGVVAGQPTGQPTQQGRCTGNCMQCTIYQRALCASQVGYYNMKMLETMMQITSSLQHDVNELAEKIEAMQNNEALLFDPAKPDANATGVVPARPIAQSGDGVR